MSIPDDITLIGTQEKDLSFPSFSCDTAWTLGNTLRELAISRNQSIVVDIRRFGQPHQPLFYTALAGTTPDSARWVQRKSNVVARFHRSSYGLGLFLQSINLTFAEKYSLPDADYAPHGGAFPITVTGTGVIGSVAISGLPQRDDHNLVVEALCIHLNRDLATLQLPTAD